MSIYKSEKVMQEWAESSLRLYLDAEEYPLLFAAMRSPKRSARLSRVDLGVLRVLLTGKQSDAPKTDERAMLAALTREEVAEIVRCHPSSVNRSVRRLNKLVRDGARASTFAKRHGLVLFHDRGYCIQPALGDLIRARSFSTKQLASTPAAHASNIDLADEREGEAAQLAAQMVEFSKLSARERAALLAKRAA